MVRVLHGTTHAALAAGVTELDEEPMEDETEPKMIELGGLQPEDFWPARQNIPYDISSRFRKPHTMNEVSFIYLDPTVTNCDIISSS